jgi:signal transduction histidine kinase
MSITNDTPGMRSATFYSQRPPSNVIGYPPQLPIVIVAIAITTCMLANGLLAHVATMSRNKLAEVMWTRRRLWTTIAQKETAEATALARGTFIASASHEIRTPLHHLQGYTDLLSQKELCDDSRALLQSIQLATRTLSLSILPFTLYTRIIHTYL